MVERSSTGRKGRAHWGLTWGGDAALDFCVGVLETDGLLVPPFDRHRGGDGSLRARGLDGATWTSWARDVVAARRAWWHSMRPRERLRHPFSPAAVWPGAPAVGEALQRLWIENRYSPHQARGGMAQWYDFELNVLPDAIFTLVRELEEIPLAPRCVDMYFVDYPGPVIHRVVDSVFAVGVRHWMPSGREFAEFIRDGVCMLTADD